jgi:hypothetical protein
MSLDDVMKNSDKKIAKPNQPRKKAVAKSLSKSPQLPNKPGYVLDLDALADIDDNSPTALSMVLQAQKEAEKTLGYLMSDSFKEIISTNQNMTAQLWASMPVIDTAKLFAGIQTDFSAIKLAHSSRSLPKPQLLAE